MKIDIEGAEADLFGDNGVSTLGSLNRFVMELHPHHLRQREIDPRSVLELFVREGFSLHAQDPLAHVFAPEFHSDDQQLYFGIRN